MLVSWLKETTNVHLVFLVYCLFNISVCRYNGIHFMFYFIDIFSSSVFTLFNGTISDYFHNYNIAELDPLYQTDATKSALASSGVILWCQPRYSDGMLNVDRTRRQLDPLRQFRLFFGADKNVVILSTGSTMRVAVHDRLKLMLSCGYKWVRCFLMGVGRNFT